MNFFSLFLFLGVIATLGRIVASTPAEDAASTVVIYNQNIPESKELADFYCSARRINPIQEIGVKAPPTEEISRSDYDLMIATPIRDEIVRRNYWIVTQDNDHHAVLRASRIHYAALVRGMPLKIASSTNNYPGDNPSIQQPPFGNCNAASVDSELSLLGLYSSQISGVINNPLALHPVGSNNAIAKTPLQIPPALLLVGRLDAPSVDAVKALIINGLKVEKEGLWGWGYIDLRSTSDPGFIVGDQWIRKAGEVMRKNGIPVLSDDLPETFQAGFPITDATAYFGWYAGDLDGPFRDPAFQFMPGAVAAHLHSFSATTLHDPLRGWTGPLIQRGASASVGNVYEPYLIFTTDFGTMEEKLLAGHNLAESYYAAQPVLSWMSVLVGDPLYRPYAVFQHPEIPSSNRWSDYRQIVLAHHGNVLMAAHDLGVKARSTGDSLYLEALGAAQEDASIFPAAEASFHDASKIAKDPTVQFRLLLEQARVFEKWGKPEKGSLLLTKGFPSFTEPSQKSLLLSWIARMNPVKPSPSPMPTSQNPVKH
jgi:uncharacterized protein (TIGR03790 family)